MSVVPPRTGGADERTLNVVPPPGSNVTTQLASVHEDVIMLNRPLLPVVPLTTLHDTAAPATGAPFPSTTSPVTVVPGSATTSSVTGFAVPTFEPRSLAVAPSVTLVAPIAGVT